MDSFRNLSRNSLRFSSEIARVLLRQSFRISSNDSIKKSFRITQREIFGGFLGEQLRGVPEEVLWEITCEMPFWVAGRIQDFKYSQWSLFKDFSRIFRKNSWRDSIRGSRWNIQWKSYGILFKNILLQDIPRKIHQRISRGILPMITVGFLPEFVSGFFSFLLGIFLWILSRIHSWYSSCNTLRIFN